MKYLKKLERKLFLIFKFYQPAFKKVFNLVKKTNFTEFKQPPDLAASQYQYWARPIAIFRSVLIQSYDHVTFTLSSLNASLS